MVDLPAPEKIESEMDEPPIFVFGVARSGTTLTYSLLLSSGRFPIYQAESRILECASRYGPLSAPKNRERFLGDFFDSRQFTRSGLSREVVRELATRRSRSWVDFLDGFMTAICRAQGKHRWVEKSPNNTNFIDELGEYYPEARFIHVIRDGRSVTVSQRKLGWGEKYSRDRRRQLIWIGNVWDMQVKAGMRAARFGDRYLQIRYHDLVTDAPGTLRRLSEFTGIELDASAISHSRVGALGGANTAFKTDKVEEGGITRAALDRWRTKLAPDEAGLLNWLLGDRLRELGFASDSVGEVTPPPLQDRVLARLSRIALEGKHALNLKTPLGRVARKPLEIGLS